MICIHLCRRNLSNQAKIQGEKIRFIFFLDSNQLRGIFIWYNEFFLVKDLIFLPKNYGILVASS